ncbi:MAG: sigma-70 family RNA polymerase sigma factor [Candidatus Promineifilaceae bacterium]|nr:sigma-70 family RNA polymerase sigma factor [Candidatus Promineifilaceae bacterium]
MTESSITDGERELVERAMSGDAEAFGRLYERYLDPLYRYIYFRVGNQLTAEDLTEEVFVRAWEALPDYQLPENGSISPWLYRIAHNLVVDEYRHRSRYDAVEPLLQVEPGPPSVEEQAGLLRSTERLAEAVSRLEPLEQNVIILRFVEGLSHREVGAIVDRSEGACRVIQHRALAALRELLKRPDLLQNQDQESS